jgi:hypothetical protein
MDRAGEATFYRRRGQAPQHSEAAGLRCHGRHPLCAVKHPSLERLTARGRPAAIGQQDRPDGEGDYGAGRETQGARAVPAACDGQICPLMGESVDVMRIRSLWGAGELAWDAADTEYQGQRPHLHQQATHTRPDLCCKPSTL